MLVTCPECDGSVSSEAVSCPNCGYPISCRRQQLEKEELERYSDYYDSDYFNNK